MARFGKVWATAERYLYPDMFIEQRRTVQEIEEKAERLRNPSGYLKTAAIREGFGPPEEAARSAGASAGVRGDVLNACGAYVQLLPM